jgi:hypothetical protein
MRASNPRRELLGLALLALLAAALPLATRDNYLLSVGTLPSTAWGPTAPPYSACGST